MAHRIYLVDDDRFLLDLYAAKFKSAGDEVTAFPSASELLADLRKGVSDGSPAPDALLIDLIMPDIDGFTALETVKKEGLAKGTKLIILSNEGQDAEIERARTLGIDGYIVKASAIPSEVLAEVTRTIGQESSPPPSP